jgi:integrase/recombinase XerD
VPKKLTYRPAIVRQSPAARAEQRVSLDPGVIRVIAASRPARSVSPVRPVAPQTAALASLSQERAFESLINDFLTDMTHANRSVHTRRAYAADLGSLLRFHRGSASSITPEILRSFFATIARLAPASRARKEAAIASFLAWAYRHELIPADPMRRLDRVRLDSPAPRGLHTGEVAAILAAIPAQRRRDQLLFRLIAELGLRVGEALTLQVEDVDLTRDDEHVSVLGKGGRRRTVLIDGDGVVVQLRAYLRHTSYRHGPLFRAEKNGRGGPLRYQSVHQHWVQYCAAAGVEATLRQLRHTHATELVNAGVSLATIRKRLGHRNLQTTLRYAEQSDAVADAELRVWRRRQPPQGR